jgi:AraC-like DNA-binding protein
VSCDDIATTRGRVDVFARAPETHYAIVVSDNAFRECGLPESVCETLKHVPSCPSLVRSAHARHLRDYVRGLLEPGFFSGWLSKTSACKNVLWLLAAAVGTDGEPLEPTRPQGRRIAAVRLCQEYIEQKMADAVTLSDLSLVSGLRPRTLINAFEAVTGTSPMAFLRARRLCRVRTVLESAHSERIRIIDVAIDWGFWHMGHFTSAYRTMFGETPSETLSRCTRAR